jgi:putative endonuclease
MKGCVYILKGINGRYYIGSTCNLQHRLKQHTYGNTQTTRNMGEWNLVLSQEYPTLLEARRVEAKIKKLKRSDYIERMIKDGYIKMK